MRDAADSRENWRKMPFREKEGDGTVKLRQKGTLTWKPKAAVVSVGGVILGVNYDFLIVCLANYALIIIPKG